MEQRQADGGKAVPSQGMDSGQAAPIRRLRSFTELSRRLSGNEAATAMLSATIETTVDGIMAVDGSGEIVACNRRFQEMWEINEELLAAGDSNQVLISLLGQVRDPVLFFEKVTELYWQPETESYDLVELRDGRWLERFSRPHYVEGKPAGRVWTFHDITELKKMESQLLHAQKMEAIGTLAGGIAHDFNNIMTAVIGYTDLLMMEFSPPAPFKGFLENIHSASHRAIALVKNLLAYSREQPVYTAKVNGNELVDNVAVLLERLAGQAVDFRWRRCLTAPVVLVDQAQMEQVLVNLVTNARDAMPEGGTLTVALEEVTLGAEEIPCSDYAHPGPYVRIAVSDTGSGMDEETRKRIFDPFFTTKEVGKGTGLGLSTSYGIVKRHGGFIRVDSEPGKGTTCSILLPKVDAAAEAAGPWGRQTAPVLKAREDGHLPLGAVA